MKKLLILLATCLIGAGNVHAQIFVTPTGAGAHNGTSWANAYGGNMLQTMMASAFGLEIWVAAGTYKPALSNRDSSFVISVNARVYGGFAGTETTLAGRNWNTHLTILSGDIGTTGVDTDNSNHVVYFTSVPDTNTILDGFVIEKGYSRMDTINNFSGYGAGILVENGGSSPTIRNCTIQNNYAEEAGGGMAVVLTEGTSEAHIVNCQFLNNGCGQLIGAGYGDGSALCFYVNGISPGPSDTGLIKSRVDSCRFTGNYGGAAIGATAIDGNCVPQISNCIINNNTGRGLNLIAQYTRYGGGMDAQVNNCRITHNIGTGSIDWGAAISLSGLQAWQSKLVVDGCLIDSNRSGIFLYPSTNLNPSAYTFSNTRFINNFDTAQYAPSSVYIEMTSDPNPQYDTVNMDNCVFYTSVPGYTGAQPEVFIWPGGWEQMNVNIRNSTFYKERLWANGTQTPTNFFTNVSGYPYAQRTNLRVTNSILYCPDTMFQAYTYVGAASYFNAITKHSIIEACGIGSLSGWTTYGTNAGGNLDLYPQFADTAHADLHLSCGSPAYNAGANSDVPGYLVTDADGTPRIKNAIVDMGAFEYQPAPPVATFTSVGTHSVTFTYTGTASGIDSLRWTFGDGGTSTATNPTHIYTVSGTFTVCVKVYSSCGKDTACTYVTVTVAGITAIVGSKTTIYPNPTKDFLTLITPINEYTILTITNSIGQLLLTEPITNIQTAINVNTLAPGLYYLTLKGESGVEVRKFVKE